MANSAKDYIALENAHGAHNYHPLDVVIKEANGCWVTDVEGNRYLDCLSAYSAVNQGHCHPKIVAALTEQAQKVALTSRAFRNDQLGPYYKELTEATGTEMVLPMNSGAEAVGTAIKAARKWGYAKKGIAQNAAEIIVCENNFHGRTTTIVGFSTERQYREGFGPFTPGFTIVPFGDIEALGSAINENTCAVLLEPIQGEGGVIIPPDGYLSSVAELCQQNNVLFIADEIQSGLGRAGKMFAFQHENVTPDLITIGKALSGGMYPVSACIGRADVLGVFTPGDHGSTFGGNPLACAVARAALAVLTEENLCERSAILGERLLSALKSISNPLIKEVRGRGLFVGIELTNPARPFCEQLKERGMLCKETHETVIRIAPPLVISEEDLDWAIEQLTQVLS